MIELTRKEDCTGCGACIDVWSHKALRMEVDNEGFWYPKVDASACTNCGLCNHVCPIINNESGKQGNFERPKTYAAYAKDHETHFVSTTGGLYSILAEEMLSRGGYIGGAVWTEDFQAKSIVSNNPEDLKRLRGSKYFQSDATDLFATVKGLLRKGEKVLVCGTPCQIAGLKNFVGKKYDENLILVDFICHCINSPEVFRKYKESLERKYGSKMVVYHPKNKEYGGWHNFAFKAVFENGAVYAANGIDDDFTYCFIGKHIAARPACYECQFKGFPRYADITIADFWGIENVDKEMDCEIGTSLVWLNNEKGEQFYESVRGRIEDKEESLEDALNGNQSALFSPVRPTYSRKLFYFALEKIDFHTLVSIMRRKSLGKRIYNKITRKVRKLWS